MSDEPKQHFSDEEAEAILREAARLDRGVDQRLTSRESLMETASELGISIQAVQEAEKRIAERNETLFAREEFRAISTSKMREKIVSWASVSVMLVGINFFTSNFQLFSNPWCVIPIGIWGVCVLAEYMRFRMNPPELDEEQFQDWLREKNFKQSLSSNYTESRSAASNTGKMLDQYFNIHPLDDRIGAIKAVRESSGLGLKEAKAVVDAYFRSRGLS